MKQGYTHVEILLDRSGSMKAVQGDTIGGFNRFLEDQKKLPGECTLSLTQFDDRYEPGFSMVPVKNVAELSEATYQPRGWTALLDAMARTIDALGDRLKSLSDSERPEKVVFVVITDGHENRSVEVTKAQVKARVDRQRDQYKWEFVFLGADLDGINDAVQVGIGKSSSYSYNATPQGTAQVYASVSRGIASARAGGQSVNSWMNDKERKKLEDTK